MVWEGPSGIPGEPQPPSAAPPTSVFPTHPGYLPPPPPPTYSGPQPSGPTTNPGLPSLPWQGTPYQPAPPAYGPAAQGGPVNWLLIITVLLALSIVTNLVLAIALAS
jgi:hypothetical protein